MEEPWEMKKMIKCVDRGGCNVYAVCTVKIGMVVFAVSKGMLVMPELSIAKMMINRL